MRVLMVNKYYRVVGGVERYISETTRLLEQKGHQVIPFAMADPHNEPTPYARYFVPSIEFFDGDRRPAPWEIAERVIYSREARQKMALLVEETRPDIAHLHNIYHYISPSVIHTLRQYDVPIVMTLHDYKLICPAYKLWVDGSICERCLGGRFYHCVRHRCIHGSLPASLLSAVEAYTHRLMHTYDGVDIFVSPSRFLREKHIAHGVEPGRIAHISNFLVLEHYKPRFDHSGYFAYAGRLTPFKGVGTLLEAVARLRPTFPLLIIGDGPSRRDLEIKARRLGLDKVRFLGHQSGTALHDLIAGAMFAVVPSEWYENGPYAVLEALALGTPVLGADIGGIPELVEPGVEGFLFEPGQVTTLAAQLDRLLGAAPPFLQELGRGGRAKMEALYNEKTHYSALSALYDRLLTPGGDYSGRKRVLLPKEY
jgi:glycosyltransferase involved in cell wall biosynthesis